MKAEIDIPEISQEKIIERFFERKTQQKYIRYCIWCFVAGLFVGVLI